MKPHLVPCPQCGDSSPYDASNPYRPFCSKRCKLIDLGQWASESYRIPDDTAPDSGAEHSSDHL